MLVVALAHKVKMALRVAHSVVVAELLVPEGLSRALHAAIRLPSVVVAVVLLKAALRLTLQPRAPPAQPSMPPLVAALRATELPAAKHRRAQHPVTQHPVAQHQAVLHQLLHQVEPGRFPKSLVAQPLAIPRLRATHRAVINFCEPS